MGNDTMWRLNWRKTWRHKRVDVLRWPILNVNCRKDGVRGQQQPLANCDTERKTEEDEWVSVEEAHWTFTDHLAIYTHCKPVYLIDAYQYTRRMVDDALSLLIAVYVAYIFHFHSYSCIRTFWSPAAADRPPWSHDQKKKNKSTMVTTQT